MQLNMALLFPEPRLWRLTQGAEDRDAEVMNHPHPQQGRGRDRFAGTVQRLRVTPLGLVTKQLC